MTTLRSRGFVTLMAIVFGAIFLGVLTALAGYTLSIDHEQDSLAEHAQASAIADAGLAQYEKHLEGDPGDTGTPNPSTFAYDNISGTQVGSYTLGIKPLSACSQTIAYALAATGTPSGASSVSVGATARYAPALSVHQFSQLQSVANSAGLYFPKYASTPSTSAGYSIVFNSNSTITVTGIKNSGAKTVIGTYPVSSSCALIYAADNVMATGVLPLPITLIATTLEATTTGSVLTFVSSTTPPTSLFTSWQQN
jgi:hypothetical protein